MGRRPLIGRFCFGKMPANTTLENINKTLDKNLSFDRWEFLYSYAIKALDQDIDRFHKLDEKISKFITIVTIIMSVFVAAIPFIFTNHVPPKNLIEAFLIYILSLTFVFLCSLWSFLFRGLRLQNVPRMPISEEVLDLFKSDKKDNTILFALTMTSFKAFNENIMINSKKIDYLNKAYDDTVYASLFIVLDLFVVAFLQLIK